MALVPLANTNEKAIVDDEDLSLVAGFKWHVQSKFGGKKKYAIAGTTVGGKQLTIRMHRIVMNAGPNQKVDHKDHNGLNNQKLNLRAVTNSQNGQNRRKHKLKTSTYKGVHRTKHGYWKSGVRLDGKQINIGTFHDEKIAAAAYNYKARQVFGQYAHLNPVPLSLEKQAQVLIENPKKLNGASKFRGVSIAWMSSKNGWRARITKNNVVHDLGWFVTEKEAAAAYNKAALLLYGSAAKLNPL